MAENGTKGQVITWMVGPAPSFKDAEKKALDALKKGKDATEAELIEAKEALEKAKNAQSPLTMAEHNTRLSLHMSVTTNLVTLFNMSPTAAFGNAVAKSWGVGSMAASGGGVAAGASKLPTMGPMLSKTNSPFTPKSTPASAGPSASKGTNQPVESATSSGGGGINGVVIQSAATVKIGRWMSEKEYKAMKESGRVQEGSGGATYGSTSGPESFGKQAPPGSVYVEYEVPANSVLQGSKPDWVMTVGPDANNMQRAMLSKLGGEFNPPALNISNPLFLK